MFSTSHPQRRRSLTASVALAVSLLATACGGDTGTDAGSDSATGDPVIVVTTSIWADVVTKVACGGPVVIETVMPIGSDAHAFEPSLADRARFDRADLIVSNGIGLEVGLLDTIAGAEEAGTPVLRLGRHIDTIPYGGAPGHSHGDEDHGDEDHRDEDNGDEDHRDEDHGDEHEDEEGVGHFHEGDDPHLWFDPVRVSELLPVLADHLVDHAGLDGDEISVCVEDYQEELAALDADIAARVADLPVERRLLVANHDTLGYFADRYDLEVLGTVSSSPSGLSETNPADLEALAQVMEQAGSRVIFAEAGASVDEAEALARRLGDAEVVILFTESLSEPGGEADTYRDLLSTNADRILDALS